MLTRREFLGSVWLALLAALAAAGVGFGLRIARPRSQGGQFGGAFRLGPPAQLPLPGGAPIHEPAGRFWLVRTSAGLLGLHKACTHLDCLCEWNEQRRRFICPCHGSQFAEDGTHIAGPAPRGLDRFVLRIETSSGRIVAETDPQTGAPMALPQPLRQAISRDLEATAQGTDDLVLVVDTRRKVRGAPSS